MGAWHSGSLPGGHGLRQFAAEIEHIGGSLSTDCENGIWIFHARIPFDVMAFRRGERGKCNEPGG